jgi:hypothetical protein
MSDTDIAECKRNINERSGELAIRRFCKTYNNRLLYRGITSTRKLGSWNVIYSWDNSSIDVEVINNGTHWVLNLWDNINNTVHYDQTLNYNSSRVMHSMDEVKEEIVRVKKSMMKRSQQNDI